MYQTTANQSYFLYGSAKIEFTRSGWSSWLNIGSAKSIKLTETWTNTDVESDMQSVFPTIHKQEITIEAEQMEFNPSYLHYLRGVNNRYWTGTEYLYTSGGLSSLAQNIFRLTNTGASSSETIEIIIYKGYIVDGMQLNFVSDDDIAVGSIPFKIRGISDLGRTAGDRLYQIRDKRFSIAWHEGDIHFEYIHFDRMFYN